VFEMIVSCVWFPFFLQTLNVNKIKY
jgi:hypothetical protein